VALLGWDRALLLLPLVLLVLLLLLLLIQLFALPELNRPEAVRCPLPVFVAPKPAGTRWLHGPVQRRQA
jgi:hypothetical protein